MPYIDLYTGGQGSKRFELPAVITGIGGHSFRLNYAVRGGGNGVVFRATPDGELATEIDHCAVKFLRQREGVRMDRFQNEIRIMQMVNHSRVAMYFDHGETMLAEEVAVPWMAMELGEANLRVHVQQNGPLSGSALARVGVQMCEALAAIHEQRIIHRDLKPDNFVWDGENEGSIIMIDFGIAKLIHEDVSGRPLDQFTQHLEFIGPVFFSSPELIAYAGNKNHPVEYRSDIFQLGKTLWFLGTGKISAGVPSRRDSPLGDRFHNLILELLNDAPEDRPSSAAEVASYLQSL